MQLQLLQPEEYIYCKHQNSQLEHDSFPGNDITCSFTLPAVSDRRNKIMMCATKGRWLMIKKKKILLNGGECYTPLNN